jgi:hypothetical protein
MSVEPRNVCRSVTQSGVGETDMYFLFTVTFHLIGFYKPLYQWAESVFNISRDRK